MCERRIVLDSMQLPRLPQQPSISQRPHERPAPGGAIPTQPKVEVQRT